MIKRECARCTATFLTLPSQIRAGKGKFCSVSCANAARRQTPEGWKARRAFKRRGLYRPKDRAREAVARAVKRGELVRLTCEVCGAYPTEAHHEDYSKPLQVRWLCRPHHRQADKALGLCKN